MLIQATNRVTLNGTISANGANGTAGSGGSGGSGGGVAIVCREIAGTSGVVRADGGGNSTFGGEDLQSFYNLRLLGSRPVSPNARIILQYRYDDFTSENTLYDYLEGWRQRAQIRYFRSTVRNNQQLYYEGELNNRGELVTSTVSYEYSPTRHTLGGKYTHKFSGRWYLTGDLAYRVSDFPASATLDRDDTRWTLAAYLDYFIDPTLQVKSNIKYLENDSTVDIYTYDKTMISIGLSKLF